MGTINKSFLLELFKLFFRKKEVLDICSSCLEYHFLPEESDKFIWKSIRTYYQTTGKIPTIGLIAQQNENNLKVLEKLEEIKQIEIPEVDDILITLENFIKEGMFQELYYKITDYFNQGEKENAYLLLKEKGEIIHNFSLKKESTYYKKIFEGFEDRTKERILNKENGSILKTKIPFSIDGLDLVSNGGIDRGDTFLFLAPSGVGKTKFLRHFGVGAARRGFRGLHIQAEGSEQECLDGYDATWSGQLVHDLDNGNIPMELLPRLRKISNDIINLGGEIYIYAPEKFDSISMKDIRNYMIEIEALYGKLDYVLLDYFELVDPGDNRKYGINDERQRREAISNKMKNLAVEFDVVFGSCTQASDVAPDKLNDPKFILTRHHISEFKLALKPFSYFITMNQTEDEYHASLMRLYCDKIRKYKSKQIIPICQAYKFEKFYDRQKTLETYYKS